MPQQLHLPLDPDAAIRCRGGGADAVVGQAAKRHVGDDSGLGQAEARARQAAEAAMRTPGQRSPGGTRESHPE